MLGALALEGAVLAIADARSRRRARRRLDRLPARARSASRCCGLAASSLWRSRKPGRLRWLRRVGLAARAQSSAPTGSSCRVAMAILATHRPRAHVAPADLGRPYEQVTLRTSDGLELAGWYVRSRNGAAVISYPTRKGKLPQARMLARHGYGVLLLDARGYDGSDGDPNMFGWGETKDIDAAVAWLQRRPDVRQRSHRRDRLLRRRRDDARGRGANTALRAVVSEGAGVRSLREELLRGRAAGSSLPEAAVQTAAVAVLSGTAPPPSLDDSCSASRRALSSIYAGHGTGGEELNIDYYRAAHTPKTLWKIPEAGHGGGFEARPHEYEQRVTRFFDRALLDVE